MWRPDARTGEKRQADEGDKGRWMCYNTVGSVGTGRLGGRSARLSNGASRRTARCPAGRRSLRQGMIVFTGNK